MMPDMKKKELEKFLELASLEDLRSYGIGNDAAAIRGHRHCKPSYYCLPLWRIYFHRL